ncbi:hypothetical protein [Paenibacillus dendritiformis]|uniref:hypothetical protein n=1 Tax=Paenibacillus dendritiformis TaxID=130049 RepID=UPI00387E0DF0
MWGALFFESKGDGTMSLCVALMDEQRIVMAADTAVSTKREGVVYRVREDCQKLYVVGDMLIFLSGDVDLSRLIMDDFMKQSNKTVEKLRDMMESYTVRYAQIRPGFLDYERESIGVLALVGKRENNKSILYEISSKGGFAVKTIAPPSPDEPIYYTAGIEHECALELVSMRLSEGQSANNAIISTYGELSSEQIGGTLQVFILDETGIEPLIHQPIKHKAEMKVVRKVPIDQTDLKRVMFCHAIITGSEINVGNGQFTVDRSGNLYAGNGRFRGAIEASSFTGGTITGSLITGARIRTAVSGDRIELDPNGFVFYDGNNSRRVTLGTNREAGISGHTYYDTRAVSQGLIYAITDELHVMGNRSLRLGANGGVITLQGPVAFTSSVSGLNVGIGDVRDLRNELLSLQSQIDSLRRTLDNHTHTVTLPTHNHGNRDNQNWGGTFTTSTP